MVDVCLKFRTRLKMIPITFIILVGISSIFVEAQRPDIVDEILPEVKQKNQTGYLNCTVVNKGSESVVQWSKVETVNGGNPILLSEDDKIVYQGNTGINEDSGLRKYDMQSRPNGRRMTYMLVIRYLAEEDAGDYLCAIRIQGVQWPEWPKKIGKLTVQIGAQRPDIFDEILPEVKQKSQTGYLNCTVVNKGSESVVQWSKVETVNDGNPILLSEDDNIVYQGYAEDSQKYDIQSRTNGRRITYMLVIRYLEEADAGDYLCTIRIQGVQWPEWPKKIGKLTVQTAPQIQPSLNAIYEKDIGSSLLLTCKAQGNPYPNITWKREDGQELPTGGFQSRGASLNLTDIQINDRGNYICVADNNVKPPASFKVEVILFFKPLCKPVQSTVGQVKNKRFNAILECIVAGFPQPSMKWMKESENRKLIEIDDDDKYDITKQFSSKLQNDEVWYTLLVRNVQATDYTNYHCVGVNKYGEGEATIVLFETMECQGLNCHYLDEILPEMKQKGETGYLNCTVLKNQYCNIVQWSKARVNETGNPILISENETIIDQEKSGLGKYDVQTRTNDNKTSYMLVIRNISGVDAGEYYCSLTPEGQTDYICDQKTGILYVNETVYCQGTDCLSSSGPQMEQFMAFLTLFLLCMEHCIT